MEIKSKHHTHPVQPARRGTHHSMGGYLAHDRSHSSTNLSHEAREGRQKGASARHLGALGESLGAAGKGDRAGSAEVQQFIQQAAAAYGADANVLSEIARRESNFNTGDIPNTTDSNARRGTPSRGMFQFIQPTFDSMAPRARAANPGAWAGVSQNWTDWRAQALTTAWAISHGQGRHWSTYRAALASRPQAAGHSQTKTA